MASGNLSIIIHGGAGALSQAAGTAPQEVPVMRQALDAAWACLENGDPGEKAVVEALRVLEGCELFDAGYGSWPNENGQIRCDVALMRGSGDFISLMNMRRVRFPSAVALDQLSPKKNLMAVWTDEMMRRLDEASDEIKARYGWVQSESEMVSPVAMRRVEERRAARVSRPKGHDTVGCVVRDGFGRIFAGTSTGGIMLKPDGRVGDSPILGAGVFADDAIAGLSATGQGEIILKSLLSSFVVADIRSFLRADSARFEREPALLKTILKTELEEMRRKYPTGEAGLIVIPVRGAPAYEFNAESMPVAVRYGKAGQIEHDEVVVATR